jgi:hypothetical protein
MPTTRPMPPAVPGLAALHAVTRGDPRIRIAVLDGPVDPAHPCFNGARLLGRKSGEPAPSGPACRHGTHVTSVLFGQPGSAVAGVAPGCTGVLIPIFEDAADGGVAPCSQLALARAILAALDHRVHLINISGGQPMDGSGLEPVLAAALAQCARRNVLVLAAAGNEGCECLHLPAALAGVLAVGACDSQGQPLVASNWGPAYREQGLLAPGHAVLGARRGGGTVALNGTSFATPRVTGVAALLLSLQLQRGQPPDPQGVRAALLNGAQPCRPGHAEGRRFLAGTLDIPAALCLVLEGSATQSGPRPFACDAADAPPAPALALPDRPGPVLPLDPVPRPGRCGHGLPAPASSLPVLLRSRSVPTPHPLEPGIRTAGDCGCGGSPDTHAHTHTQLVYALGTLGHDFGSQAQRDSFSQAMPAHANQPDTVVHLLHHLEQQPHEAQAVIWTLNLEATPIYAIAPSGPFAALAYERLRSHLRAQHAQAAELVSIPGHIGGSVRLASGQVVPLLVPELRGMYSWSTDDLLASTLGQPVHGGPRHGDHECAGRGLRNYLHRICYGMRNLGRSGEERALNHSATQAFQAALVVSQVSQGDFELDTIEVSKSPIGRPGAECYDVQIHFFNPANTRMASRMCRFTVDVSAVIPVSLGPVRSWSVRR